MTPQEYEEGQRQITYLRNQARASVLAQAALAPLHQRTYEIERQRFNQRVEEEGVTVEEHIAPDLRGVDLRNLIRPRDQWAAARGNEDTLRGRTTDTVDAFRGMGDALDAAGVPTPPDLRPSRRASAGKPISGTQHHRLRFTSTLES